LHLSFNYAFLLIVLLWFDFIRNTCRIFGICFLDSNISWYLDALIKGILVFDIIKR